MRTMPDTGIPEQSTVLRERQLGNCRQPSLLIRVAVAATKGL